MSKIKKITRPKSLKKFFHNWIYHRSYYNITKKSHSIYSKTRSNNQFILTKFLILILLSNQQATTIILKFFDNYIYIFSSRKSHILTGNRQNFVCRLMEQFEKAFHLTHKNHILSSSIKRFTRRSNSNHHGRKRKRMGWESKSNMRGL